MAITELLERNEALPASAHTLASTYLRSFDEVASYYAADFRTLDALRQRCEDLASEQDAFRWLERDRLSRKLASYARSLGASPHTLANIQRLKKDATVCVVTGQQPSIAGGPAFVLYKAAHAIRLAQELTQAGVKCVPIFWVASEDHDVDEINLFASIDRDNRYRSQRLSSLPSATRIPLDKVDLPDITSVEGQKLDALLRDGPARKEASELLELALASDCGRGMARLLLRVFADQGLIVLEPRLLRDLQGFKAIAANELHDSREHQMIVENSLAHIRDQGFGLPLQATSHLNLFYIYRGERRHIERVANGFAIAGIAKPKTRHELLAELDRYPQRFSTNVRLRPVVQGACLPTVAYIGGPSEISYHAALRELFERNNTVMPSLIPRWSFLLAPQKDDEIGELRNLILQQSTKAKRAGAAISETQVEARALFQQLDQQLGHLAKALANDSTRILGRVEKSLLELRGRILAHPIADTEVAHDHRDSALWCYPNNTPQERALSWLALWPEWRGELLEAFKTRSAFDFSLAVVKHGK